MGLLTRNLLEATTGARV